MEPVQVYYITIISSDKVYVLDKTKYVHYVGSKRAGDVVLQSIQQLHDDDTETDFLAIKVGAKSYPCCGTRQFATEKEFEAWRTL